jgi:hypothetical protein
MVNRRLGLFPEPIHRGCPGGRERDQVRMVKRRLGVFPEPIHRGCPGGRGREMLILVILCHPLYSVCNMILTLLLFCACFAAQDAGFKLGLGVTKCLLRFEPGQRRFSALPQWLSKGGV